MAKQYIPYNLKSRFVRGDGADRQVPLQTPDGFDVWNLVILLTLTLSVAASSFKQNNPQRVSFDRTMVTVHWNKRREP